MALEDFFGSGIRLPGAATTTSPLIGPVTSLPSYVPSNYTDPVVSPMPQGNWWIGNGTTNSNAFGANALTKSFTEPAADPTWLQKIGFTGDKNGAGWGGLALGAIQGGANIFMGMKQYGMAKDALAQAKDQYDRNYAAQKTTTNAMMEDRQRARIASSPGAYVSVDQYMAQNGIK